MRLRVAAALAAAVVASVLAVPAAAVEWVAERAYVPTPHGALYVDYVRPEKGRAPVLLTFDTNRDEDVDYPVLFTSPADAYRKRYTRQGYAHAVAEPLGTGRSGGCWGFGGLADAQAAAAVVEWLGTRPWSTGRVGLYGYWNVLDVATLAPRHLAAVVPQGAVSSWYGLEYDHGVTQFSVESMPPNSYYVTNVTPELVGIADSLPRPDPARVVAAGPAQAVEDWATPCDVVEHEARGRLARPAYDAFWRERDWALRARDVKAAVLFQHGWRNMVTKPEQFTRYWAGLRDAADRRALIGQWSLTDAGANPDLGFPIAPEHYLDLFLARHLKGARVPGLDRVPRVLTEGSDRRVRTTLPLQAAPTAFRLAERAGGGAATFVNTGTETSVMFKADVRAQRGFVAYEFPVRGRTRLSGPGEAVLRLTSSAPRGQVAVTLLDVAPGATEGRVITLGLLDLRFRDSLAAPRDVPVGTPFTARVRLRPQDYVLPEGHRLVVAVAGSDVVWGVPDPVAGQQVTVHRESVVRLPLVDPRSGLVG